MPDPDASPLRRHRPFLLYVWARGLSELAAQVALVAMGWQVYALTGSAFDLGMLGLVQFVPTALLTFVAGHAADRIHRRRLVQAALAVQAGAALLLAWSALTQSLSVVGLYAAVAVFGIAAAFEEPAAAALLVAVVPQGRRQHATAFATGAFQLAAIAGPAAGGLLYAVSPSLPYATMAVAWAVAALLLAPVHVERLAAQPKPTPSAVFEGVRFVWRNKALLGAISLDLFAVLLGGVTSLLPIYARDILQTGPWGLGLLRGAPAVGALLMAAALSRHPIERRTGLRMFQAVIVFGLATVVFAVSRNFALSVVALAVLGAGDMVSMVVRGALVQLRTPDAMRGRVGAVHFLFVNASGQIGGFESGVTAALFGAMPAAALGGLGTILVALLWMKLFPELRAVEQLDPLPVTAPPDAPAAT